MAIWRDVLAQLGEIEPPRSAGRLQGSIVLTAPELFGRLKVMPVLEPFLRQQPRVSARVLLVNRLVNLVGEGMDLAVRLAPLPDSAMTAISLGEVRILVCASPDYLAWVGSPTNPHELNRHDCIGLNAEGDGDFWPFGSANEKGARVRSVRVPTRLSLNNAGAAIDAALRGHGLIRARAYQVAEDVAAGRLVHVLPGRLRAAARAGASRLLSESCGQALKRGPHPKLATTLNRRGNRRPRGVPIDADRDPGLCKFSFASKSLRVNLVGSRFNAYPHRSGSTIIRCTLSGLAVLLRIVLTIEGQRPTNCRRGLKQGPPQRALS